MRATGVFAAGAPAGREACGPEPAWSVAHLSRHRGAYLASARRILACPAGAEDVVQDVMLRLAADPPPTRPARQAAYAARMVRNLALDRARRQGFERRVFAPLDAMPEASAAGPDTPERQLCAREALERVQAAIQRLPEPARTAFRLHRVEGVPQNVVAARLGVSRALVCGLVRRGHLDCLAALDARCRDCPARGPMRQPAG